MSVSFNKVFCDLSKLEPLDGTNYKRWSQKLLIFFEQLEIDYVLSQDAPENEATPEISIIPLIGSSQNETGEAKRKFEKDNRTARGHLLNQTRKLARLKLHKRQPLYNIPITKETLEKKYSADDAGKKKYVVGNWLRFWMLKYKKRDLSLQELISHMRTEEANRLKDKQISNSYSSVEANLVESARTSKNRNKGKDKYVKYHQRKNFTPRQNDHKIQKLKGSCYVCGNQDIKLINVKDRKDQQILNQRLVALQANLVEEEIIVAVVVETNLVEDKSAWIMDNSASRHL
ncbi:hypothetical protein Tco_1466457 [Tanacetum coccineum]